MENFYKRSNEFLNSLEEKCEDLKGLIEGNYKPNEITNLASEIAILAVENSQKLCVLFGPAQEEFESKLVR